MKLKAISIILIALTVLTACGAKEETGHDAHNAPADRNGQEQHGNHGGGSDFEIKTTWNVSADKPGPNQDTKISIQVHDAKGMPIEKFDVNHEKQLHLIIVNKDLTSYQHVHPYYKGKGLFEITHKFPQNGDYKLIADFIPSGAKQKTEQHWVQAGKESTALTAVTPDASMTKIIDGKEITLSFNKLESGKEVQMTYTCKDDKTKTPITNLEPYLGAVGHVVIISSDVEQYIHNHPLDEKAAGPEAKFATTFPKAGIYKIWGEFKQNGQVFTVPFVVKVP